MKNLITLAILTWSFSAIAYFEQADKVLATYSFSIRTQQDTLTDDFHSSFESYEVQFNEGKEIVVYQVQQKSKNEVARKLLVKPVAYALIKDAQHLSNVKVTITQAQIVCSMMPSPDMSNDFLKVRAGFIWQEGFTGELRTVRGPRGCWVKESISLKGQHIIESAAELRRSLKLLALELIYQ